MKKGISLIILIVTIVIIIIISGAVILNLIGEDSIINKSRKAVYDQNISAKDEAIMISEMNVNMKGYNKKNAELSADFIQPWMCVDWTKEDFDVYFKKLKDNNIKIAILQNTIGSKVIDGTAKITEKYFWENTSNSFNKDINNRKDSNCINSSQDVVHNFIKSAQEHDIKVFLGLASVGQWFEEKFVDEVWRNEINAINNLMIDYLISEYKDAYSNTFYGIYYPLEFYTNNKDYEKLYWNSMLKNTREYLTKVERKYLSEMPFLISPYCSDLDEYEIKGNDSNEVKSKMTTSFGNLIDNNALKGKDIVCPQDKIATQTNRSTDYSIIYLEAVRDAVLKQNKNNINKIEYWINIENFNYIPNPVKGFTEAGKINRLISQISIARTYTENLAFFSYAHYYMDRNSSGKPVQNLNEKEKEFGNFVKSNYDKVYGNVDSNKVDVKVLENGMRIYIPKGFYYVTGDLNTGVVISDAKEDENKGDIHWALVGNQFVWVPIDGTINKFERDTFRIDENKITISEEKDSYWENIDTEYNNMVQSVKKYKGFFVARYEPSILNLNKIQYVAGQNVKSFVSYDEAKLLSSEMYKNSNSVKSHLMYGVEWDSMLNSFVNRAVTNTNSKFTLIQLRNSILWGNYAPNLDNRGSQKVAGDASRMETQVCNIFDVAGNFWEITQEKFGNDEKPTLRGGSFWETGDYNPSVSRFIPQNYGDYKFLTSFRTALYIIP